ncbi:MAG TPA: hypothetical protein PLR60_14395 [Syntrophorhabdaceae bacterium]|nr:hypothetical protein [Syntrophorhabdaceae bacterium]
MNGASQSISKQEKEGLSFLERDFNQCFQQMRQYDSQIVDILKFMFTAYSALIGVAFGLYQFGRVEGKDLSLSAASALSVGLLIGLFMLGLTIRNRVYFVRVARYINEHRGFFLSYKPLGFENKAKMYANHEQPHYFNWKSSHSWLCYIEAVLNGTLLTSLVYIIKPCMWRAIVSGLFLLSLQLVVAVVYLRSCERKSPSETVFGKK